MNCHYCGVPREEPRFKLCTQCRADSRMRVGDLRAERSAAGLCSDCGNASGGTARCDSCARTQAVRVANWRKEHRAKRHAPALGGGLLCRKRPRDPLMTTRWERVTCLNCFKRRGKS